MSHFISTTLNGHRLRLVEIGFELVSISKKSTELRELVKFCAEGPKGIRRMHKHLANGKAEKRGEWKVES